MLLSNCIYMYSAFAPKIDLKCSIPFLASYSLDIFMGFLFYLVPGWLMCHFGGYLVSGECSCVGGVLDPWGLRALVVSMYF